MTTAKNKFSILVIEDERSDYDVICKKLNCNDFEIIPTSTDFQKMKNAMSNTRTNTIFNYVNEVINNNYQKLRAIICDLNLVGDKDKGGKIIEYIRSIKLENSLYSEFTRFIPIIVYTAHSETLAGTAIIRGGSLYIDKKADETVNCLADIVKKHISNFSFLCDKFILKRQFKIGLSFTGVNDTDKTNTILHRPFIEEIANKLAFKFGVDSVFYDNFHRSKINGLKANKKLTNFYQEQCDYILVFLSADYATTNKPWTGIEWTAVKKYAKDNADKIILIQLEDFDATSIVGINKWFIYEDAHSECAKFKSDMKQNKKDELTKKLLGDVIFKKIT